MSGLSGLSQKSIEKGLGSGEGVQNFRYVPSELLPRVWKSEIMLVVFRFQSQQFMINKSINIQTQLGISAREYMVLDTQVVHEVGGFRKYPGT
jgi:hypothetical protein